MKLIQNTTLIQSMTLIIFSSQFETAMGLRGSRSSPRRNNQRSLQSSKAAYKLGGGFGGAAANSSNPRQREEQLVVTQETIATDISSTPSETTVPSFSTQPSIAPSLQPSITQSSVPSIASSVEPSIAQSSAPSHSPVRELVGGGELVSFEASTLSTEQQAIYDVTFTNLWSASRHPPLYPGSAHWSPPVCVAHSSNYQMWSPDTLSTPGVQSVAETGGTTTLFREFNDADSAIGGTVRGRVTFNRSQQSQSISEFIVDKDHPFISSITMIAPSPDWFTGFYDLEPVSASGTWWRSFTVETYPFDAGTDSGITYQAANQATNPHEKIFELTPDTVPSSSVFLLNGDTVLPVGQWTFVLRE